MARIRFSASSLEHALAQEPIGASSRVVWDSETRGLGFYANRRRPGSFFVQFRVGGRQRKVTLGRLNELTIPEARKAANEIMVAARQGRDVIKEQRQSHVATLTLGAAFDEYHSALKRRAVSSRTLAHNEGVWRRMLAKYAARELTTLTKREVRSWHTGWGERGPTAANHAGRLLRTVYNYASKRLDDLPPNPCVAIEWFPEREQRDVIDPADLPDWWAKVGTLENSVRAAYWRFLLFSGLRKTDAASVRWSEVSETGIHRPNPKGGRTRAFTVPMTKQLAAILADAKAAGAVIKAGSEWVFPASSASGHIAHAAEKEFPSITPHDLRRTYATACIEAGIDPYTVKLLLNHTPDKGDVTARYVRPSSEHIQQAAQKVADHIAGIIGSNAPRV